MKRKSTLSVTALISFCSAVGAAGHAAASTRPEPPAHQAAPERPAAAIPFDQIGAAAAKQYTGDGLAVASTPDGAKLRCVFQRLNANVTTGGLWLASTKDGAKGEPFRVTARALGRGGDFPRAGLRRTIEDSAGPGRTFEDSAGPEGTSESSPTLQRWVPGPFSPVRPGGVAIKTRLALLSVNGQQFAVVNGGGGRNGS